MKDYSKRYDVRILMERLAIVTTNIQNAQSYSMMIDFQNGDVRFNKYVDDTAIPVCSIIRMCALVNMSYQELVDYGKQL